MRVVALPLLVDESRFCIVDTPELSVVSTGVTAPSGERERGGHNKDGKCDAIFH